MWETATGFAVVAVAVLAGYVIGRVDLLGSTGQYVLGRLTFFVLSPFLLFSVLSQADVDALFSSLLPVSAIAAAVVIIPFTLVSSLLWKRPAGEVVIGALSAGQVNSSNIGIPLSVYVLGSAAYPAPVILMQLLVLTPIAMGTLDAVTSERRSILRVLARAVTNPLVVGSLAGALVSLSGVELPEIATEPVQLIADACVPVLLMSYGMSLHGQRVLGSAGRRRDVVLASALKLFAMPLAAWAVATWLFGLRGPDVLVVVVLAALPTAQNVFNYSQRYGIGSAISRDTVFITTIGCLPVLFVATLFLG